VDDVIIAKLDVDRGCADVRKIMRMNQTKASKGKTEMPCFAAFKMSRDAI
jgi:hypothetical protein